MPLRIVRYSQVPSTPWKNGLGVTRQLAIHPHDATPECFEWRISIARLDQSAAFSPYPGIDRCLAVLEGVMTLQRAATESLTLTADSPPVRFAGDVVSSGAVVRGPVLDLNVMCQAAHWHASLSRLASSEMPLAVDSVMLCSLAAVLRLQLAGARITLGLYDLLLVSGNARELVAADCGGFDAYRIELQPH